MSVISAFSPNMVGATVGQTQAVIMTSGTPTAGSGTISGAGYTDAVLVTNASSLIAFVRICAVQGLTASASDLPVQPAGQRLIAAPSEAANIYVYAIPAATLGAGSTVYFTPGNGGGGQT